MGNSVRRFRIHEVLAGGLVHLAEVRADEDVVIGVPVALPTGTVLKPEKGPSWVILRQVGKAVAFNRSGVKVGLEFRLLPSKPLKT